MNRRKIAIAVGLVLILVLVAVALVVARDSAPTREARVYNQLTALLKPVDLKSMTDHRAYMTEDGAMVVALHFDNMDLAKAKNLNWIAVGVKGRFCRQDQQRIEKELGAGFTHFHDFRNDAHGGAPGVEGVWFKHIAVRNFSAPWGEVKPGVDLKFMPTQAPQCP